MPERLYVVLIDACVGWAPAAGLITSQAFSLRLFLCEGRGFVWGGLLLVRI